MADTLSVVQFEGTVVECSPDEDVDIILNEAEPNIDALELVDSLTDSDLVFLVSKCGAFSVLNWMQDKGIAHLLDVFSSVPDHVYRKYLPQTLKVYGCYPFLDSIRRSLPSTVNNVEYYCSDIDDKTGSISFLKVRV